jgi:hypothetical protein
MTKPPLLVRSKEAVCTVPIRLKKVAMSEMNRAGNLGGLRF